MNRELKGIKLFSAKSSYISPVKAQEMLNLKLYDREVAR